MTNKHIGIITILLSLVVNITIVNAAEEGPKIKNFSINNSGVDYTMQYKGNDGNTFSFCGAATMDIIYEDGTKITAYCIDPFRNAPNKDSGEIISSTADSSYTYLWNKICGNGSVCNNIKNFVAAARTLTANYKGDGGPLKNTKTKIGKTYGELYSLIGTNSFLINGNTDDLLAKVKTTSSIGTADETKEKTNTGLNIMGSPGNRVIVKGTSKQTSFLNSNSYCNCTETDGKSTCVCELDKTYCANGGESVKISIPNTSDNTSCTVTQFSNSSQQDTQRFIGCVPDNTATSKGEIELTCDPQDEPDDCMDPTTDEYCDNTSFCDQDCQNDECSSYDYAYCEALIDDLSDYGNDNVAHICNSDGELAIEYEAFDGSTISDLSWDQVKCCLYDENNINKYIDEYANSTTSTILGDLISSSGTGVDKSSLETFCPISCTVKYSLNIPGPTSKMGNPLGNDNNSVYINAGTFFTIDDSELKSIENLTCHMDLNAGYDNLLNYVYRLRSQSVDAFNKYIEIKTKMESKYTIKTTYSCTKPTNVCPSDECFGPTTGKECYYYVTNTYPATAKTDSETGETLYCCGTDCTTSSHQCQTRQTKYVDANAIYNYQIKSDNYNQYKYNESNYQITNDHQNNFVYTSGDYYSYAEAENGAIKWINDYKQQNQPEMKSYENQMKSIKETIPKLYGFYKSCSNALNESNLKKIEGNYRSNYKFEFWYSDSWEYGNPSLVAQESSYDYKGSTKKGNTEASNIISYSGVCTPADECKNGNKSENGVFSNKTAAGELIIETPYKFDNCFCVTNDGKYIEYQQTPDSVCSEEKVGTACEVKGSSGIIQKGFPVSPEDTQGQYTYEYSYELPNGEYYTDVCYYDVNSCKECNTYCQGQNCYGNNSSCGTGCQTACVGSGCIFESSIGFMPTYKTISLNNTFALLEQSGNVLAIASSTKSNATNSGKFSNWTTEKGTKTKEKILKEGEGIYANEPEYSIVLDASTINNIKEYNKEHSGYSSLDSNTFQNVSKDGKITHTMYESKFVTQFLCDNENSCDRKNKEINYTVYSGDWKGNEFVGPAWK